MPDMNEKEIIRILWDPTKENPAEEKRNFGELLFLALQKVTVPKARVILQRTPKEPVSSRRNFCTRLLDRFVGGMNFSELSLSPENRKSLTRYLLRKVFLYLLSAGTSLLIDLGLYYLFGKLFQPLFADSVTKEFYTIFATVAARILSSLYNYFFNYRLVFQSRKEHKKAATEYFLLVAAHMILSALLTYGVSEGLHLFFGPEPFSSFASLLIKLLVDGTLFLVSFFIQRKYIY